MSKLYSLYSVPYLDHYTKQYRLLISIEPTPTRPILKSMTKQIKKTKLNEFESETGWEHRGCIEILHKENGEYYSEEDFSLLITRLIEKGIVMNQSLTTMIQNQKGKERDKTFLCVIEE